MEKMAFLFFSSYKKLVRRKYETERHIAANYNNVKMLELQFARYIGV